MTTKTCALWNEHRLQYDAMHDALAKQAAEEFSPGARVTWTHSFERGTNAPIKRTGIVQQVSHGRACIQMKPGGPKHWIAGHLIDFAPETKA